ncbi:TPA: KEOPS complex subunit [Candidatus Bathyarchaeota archaeon]|nr:KEOPS complex subunit [Candidatus Bathyarchaeota archaeon]
MKMEARVSLMYQEERKAKAILEAVSPDNVNTPKSLSIKAFTEDNKVILLIKYDGENFLTLQSTIDDLLSCVSVAEKTISALKG